MANMVGAFFGKTNKKDRIFDGLKIADEEAYSDHLNQHEVIYIDFSRTPKDCKSYKEYIGRIQDGIVEDMVSAYPDFFINREDAIWDVFQKIHEETEDRFFNETELSAIVNLCYLSARNWYRIEREDRAGKGFVDFIFYPERKNSHGIILELKVDSTPDEAIAQIKNKNYALRFKGRLGEKSKHTEQILAVGISYSKKTKEHKCKVELLQISV